jgi:hypothetical protein
MPDHETLDLVDLPEAWNGTFGMFGGFVLSRFVAAATEVLGAPPVALTLNFAGSVSSGPATMTTRHVHSGLRTGTVQLELHQSNRLRAHGVALSIHSGGLLSSPASVYTGPDPSAWPSWTPEPRPASYADHLDLRREPLTGAPVRARCWLRLTHDGIEEALGGPAPASAVFLDALPPLLMLRTPRPRFVPSVEFTLHLSPVLPIIGTAWVLGTNRLLWSDEAFCSEEATLQTTDGTVIARLRQTRAIEWQEGL